jgi:hypothetical protein
VVNQRDLDGVLQIISPTSSATADLTYPMPAWDEREYAARMYATAIERAVIALSLACVLFTSGLMAYIFARRKQQIFQAAGLPFYMLMGVGCIVAYLSTPHLASREQLRYLRCAHLAVDARVSHDGRPDPRLLLSNRDDFQQTSCLERATLTVQKARPPQLQLHRVLSWKV